jgi:hypothetical protein
VDHFIRQDWFGTHPYAPSNWPSKKEGSGGKKGSGKYGIARSTLKNFPEDDKLID